MSARVESGTLKVLLGACPNRRAEAERSRYSAGPPGRNAEVPVDAHNHARAALRYLVSRLDRRPLARARRAGDTH